MYSRLKTYSLLVAEFEMNGLIDKREDGEPILWVIPYGMGFSSQSHFAHDGISKPGRRGTLGIALYGRVLIFVTKRAFLFEDVNLQDSRFEADDGQTQDSVI